MQRSWIAIALALAFLASANPTTADPLEDLQVVDRHIVGFHEMPEIEEGDTYHGEKVVGVDTDLGFIVIETMTYPLFELRIQQDENVRYVEPDASEHRLEYTPNDPLYTHSGHYGVKTTKINKAWDTTRGSTAVKVAIIDSGLRKSHEDIKGSRVLGGWDFRFGDSNPNDASACGYHGMHVTGTALASINNGKGIAGVSQSNVLPVRIFGGSGCTTTTTTIVNGLKYAGDQGAHVSSNSWGGGSYSTAINDAITYAHKKGTNHVGAAGNAGPCTDCVGQPWKNAGDRAIVVSCSNASDGWCSFSSQGPQVDVAAPGNGIVSLYGGSDTQYSLKSGTSMSTPHVAGVLALIETRYPGLSFASAEGKIKNSADSIGLSSDRQGAGRLDGQGAIA